MPFPKIAEKSTLIDRALQRSSIANLGVLSLIPAQSPTFVETDHEIFSMVVLLLLLIQEGLGSVTSESMCTKEGLIHINKMGVNNLRMVQIWRPGPRL